MTLEVWQRSALVWRGASLPHGTPITVNGYAYTLNTTQNGDKIELQIGSPGAAEPRRSTFDR